jgi:hypothetical protein
MESGAKAMIGRGEGGMGAKIGAATMTTTNMTLMTRHRQHRRSDN